MAARRNTATQWRVLQETRMRPSMLVRAALVPMLWLAGAARADDPLSVYDALLAREPRHIGAMHHAARLAASAGDGDRAIGYLRMLVRAGFDDALEPTDFAALAGREDYRRIAALFDGISAVGAAALHAESQCAGVLPEGAAYDAARRRFLMSGGRRRSVVAVDAAGACEELVPPGDGGLLSVLGMDMAADGALWVASAAAPFMLDAASAQAGQTLLSRIDLRLGRVVASFAPPAPGLLNDLDLLPDGRIAVTDSLAGTVYLLDPSAASPQLRALVPANSFEGPNGVVALPGGHLLVADFHALWLLDPAADVPRPRRLAARDDRYMGGMDGLARDGDHVVAIQNLVGRGRVWRFRVDPDAARLEELQLLLRRHPDLRNPTTGVVADGRFLFVADPLLQAYVDGAFTPLPAGRRGHRILALPLP